MSARRPTPAYNALNYSPDLGYGLATTPSSINPDWYQQYLRSIGGWQPQIAPAPGLMVPPPQQPAPEAPALPQRWRSLSDDEDADLAGMLPRNRFVPTNALAAYGRRRF